MTEETLTTEETGVVDTSITAAQIATIINDVIPGDSELARVIDAYAALTALSILRLHDFDPQNGPTTNEMVEMFSDSVTAQIAHIRTVVEEREREQFASN